MIFALIVLAPRAVSAQAPTAPPSPSCENPIFDANLDANGNGVVTEAERGQAALFVNGTNIRDGLDHISIAVALPAGRFSIDEATAWDGYPTRASTEAQLDERFALEFRLAGAVVATSAFTGSGGTDGDGIDTGVIADFWAGPLGEVDLPDGADEIRLIHSVPSIATGANSVSPSAVCLSPVLGSIGDFVWSDLDGDGVQDAGEPGVAGVTVNLLDIDGNVLGTTTTDGSGAYLFDDLPAADYVVEFVAPGGTTLSPQDQGGDDGLDSDADPLTGLTGVVSLGVGEDRLDVDAGLIDVVPLGSIGDFVWFDLDGDGIQDPDEPGVAGVTVNLTDADCNVIATTTTDANGNYLFENLAAGDYHVQVIAPAGTGLSPQDQGGDDAADSDVGVDGKTDLISLDPGEVNLTVDAGLVPLGSIGDFVWSDLDGDGVQDPDEPGVAGVTVELLDSDGTVLATTTTDADGGYLFDDLPAGDYVVEFVAPDGTSLSPQDQGGDDSADSDADPTTGRTGTVSLGVGQDRTDVDAGLIDIEPASLGDFVWFDTNADGFQDPGEPGVPGVEIVLWVAEADGLPAAEVASTTTDADGLYRFDGLDPNVEYIVQFLAGPLTEADAADDDFDSDADPDTGFSHVIDLEPGEHDPTIDAGLLPGSIGDRVWLDLDGDGIQDPDELGVEGVTVNLTDADCNVIATTTTDANGNYLFDNLPEGEYRVQVIPTDGTVLSPQNQGDDDAADSDVDAAGKTDIIDLAPGENNLTVDAGLTPSSSIGDTVWRDLDDDGVQGEDEPGVEGVTVNLLDGDGNVVDTTTTDGDGFYLFDDLPAATYIVEFVEPENLALSIQGEGDDRELDSDPDPLTGRTSPIELGVDDHRRDVDAGLTGENSVGNIAWFDDNANGLQDAGEEPIAGVVLELIGPGANGVIDSSSQTPRTYAMDETVAEDGTRTIPEDPTPVDPPASGSSATAAATGDDVVLATQTTDANGFYTFGQLPLGNYVVCARLDSLPEGYVPTEQNARGSRADHLDNDIDPGTGCTFPLFFQTGNVDMTLDLGVMRAAQVDPQTVTPLAVTGSNSANLLRLAIILTGAGSILLLVARRRDEHIA